MLHLDIITPEKVTFSDSVSSVVVPGADGIMEILPRHVALFSQLIDGEVKIKKTTGTDYLAIGGGFIEVKNDTVTILVTRAVYAEELQEQEIIRAKEAAEKALKEGVSEGERVAAQQLFRRSLVDMQVLRRRKKHIV